MESIKKIFVIFFLFYSIHFYSHEILTLDDALPGSNIIFEVVMLQKIKSVLPDCECIKIDEIDGRNLSGKIHIENYKYMFPKKIFIKYRNAQMDTLVVKGNIEKILPEVNYFYSSTCKKCRNVKQMVKKYCLENKIYVNEYDINESENLSKLFNYDFQLDDIKSNILIYQHGDKGVVLNGKEEIEKKLSQIGFDSKSFEKNQKAFSYDDSNLKSKLKLPMVILTGLVDGINPCAFATLFFFIAMLSYMNFSSKELYKIGFSFILGIFITYLILGFGIFKSLSLLAKYHLAKNIFNWFIWSFLLFFIILTLIDILKYLKTGKTSEMRNQLPNKFKKKIHSLVRNGLKSKFAIISMFLIGSQIAILEGVCTGQIYLPIIKVILRDSFDFYAASLLFLYNLMFILPLIVILIISNYFKHSIIADFFKKRFMLNKIIFLLTLLSMFLIIILFN